MVYILGILIGALYLVRCARIEAQIKRQAIGMDWVSGSAAEAEHEAASAAYFKKAMRGQDAGTLFGELLERGMEPQAAAALAQFALPNGLPPRSRCLHQGCTESH